MLHHSYKESEFASVCFQFESCIHSIDQFEYCIHSKSFAIGINIQVSSLNCQTAEWKLSLAEKKPGPRAFPPLVDLFPALQNIYSCTIDTLVIYKLIFILKIVENVANLALG